VDDGKEFRAAVAAKEKLLNLFSATQQPFTISRGEGVSVITLTSQDGMNRLTRETVTNLTEEITHLSASPGPLIITGNPNFSAGADLNEIAALTAPQAYTFSAMGQELMHAVASFPATVIAAINGYCMGGGLDLALASHRRIAAPSTVFGHRGAALGLITGWGGTARLPRLIGKGRAIELFITAEKLTAQRALEIGLVNALADDPVAEAKRQLSDKDEPLRDTNPPSAPRGVSQRTSG